MSQPPNFNPNSFGYAYAAIPVPGATPAPSIPAPPTTSDTGYSQQDIESGYQIYPQLYPVLSGHPGGVAPSAPPMDPLPSYLGDEEPLLRQINTERQQSSSGPLLYSSQLVPPSANGPSLCEREVTPYSAPSSGLPPPSPERPPSLSNSVYGNEPPTDPAKESSHATRSKALGEIIFAVGHLAIAIILVLSLIKVTAPLAIGMTFFMKTPLAILPIGLSVANATGICYFGMKTARHIRNAWNICMSSAV